MSKIHALTFVTITLFLDTVGFGLIIPIFPTLLVEITGGDMASSSAMSGYLTTVFAVAQLLFSPLLGSLSDRFGRRPVLITSLFFLSINFLILGLADSLWLLFLGRVLTGITAATYATASALIADVSPSSERAQNFGLMGIAFGLGFIFGPALGGVLGSWDVRAPFFAAAGLTLLNTMYGLFFLQETLPKEQRRTFAWKRANPVGAMRQISRYPALSGLIACMFLYAIGHHVFPSNWNFYTIERFAWSPLDVGLSLAFVGVMAVAVQGGLLRWVIPKFGAERVACFGIGATILAYLGVASAASVTTLYIWIAISSLGGLTGPAVQSIMTNQLPQNEQGELQGVIASVNSLAMILGPLAITQSFTYFTSPTTPIYLPSAAFLFAAAITVISLGIFVRQASRLNRLLHSGN